MIIKVLDSFFDEKFICLNYLLILTFITLLKYFISSLIIILSFLNKRIETFRIMSFFSDVTFLEYHMVYLNNQYSLCDLFD